MTAAVADHTSHQDGFVHLHVHTEYSMLDGAARLKDMFAECERAGMPAVAMTDHGNLYGAYDFWSKATKAGIKPIIGIEAYVAPEHRRHRQPVRWGTPAQKDDDVSGAGAYTHMTLLAETTEGMHNLFRLSSLASLEGYFRKPRMDRELLAAHAKGIIATTGCPQRRGADPAPARPVRAGGRGGRRVPGHLRAGQLLRRDHGPRPEHRAAGPGRPAPHRPGTGPAVRGHQRLALHGRGGRESARGAALRADRVQHGRPGPVQVRRHRLLPEEPAGDARGVHRRGVAVGLRLHPAHRRAGGRRLPAEATSCRCSRRPGGGDRGKLAAPGSLARDGPPLPGRLRRAAPRPGRVRDGHHHPDGLLLVLPGRRRLHHVGQAERDLGRPGPRLGRWLPGRLRAGHHRPGPAACTA